MACLLQSCIGQAAPPPKRKSPLCVFVFFVCVHTHHTRACVILCKLESITLRVSITIFARVRNLCSTYTVLIILFTPHSSNTHTYTKSRKRTHALTHQRTHTHAHIGLPRVHRIGVDVMTEDWVSLIKRYGFLPDRPTAWLLEGFLYYFDQPDVMRTLAAVSQLSAPRSRIGMSAVSAAAAAPKGGKWKWGSDFPEAVLEEFGWDESLAYELGCPSIAEGWDTSFVCPRGAPEPRDLPDVKRTWYVTGSWPGEPPANERERLQQWMLKTWRQVKPWVEIAGRHALQFATTGFQVRLPIPSWLADVIRK